MIEKITYIACDGKEFFTKDECVKYERKLAKNYILMLGFDGKETTCLGDAAVIYISDDAPASVYDWLDYAAKVEESHHEGIRRDDVGLYYWDERVDTYRYLDEEIACALSNFFKMEKF